jgi:hypothetical protein
MWRDGAAENGPVAPSPSSAARCGHERDQRPYAKRCAGAQHHRRRQSRSGLDSAVRLLQASPICVSAGVSSLVQSGPSCARALSEDGRRSHRG